MEDAPEVEDSQEGYLVIEENPGDIWNNGRTAELPPNWLTPKGRVKKDYSAYIPVRVWVKTDGSFSSERTKDSSPAWFIN